ncbi:hypothetical protein GCM10023203_37730 [Actinomycetospora straminea]|uniref:Uncharacterized protein n=1 Tax=Actinomycetospora straminea TaxID=663607 RepID=A0ABP9ELR9_9PSEU
MPRAEAAHRGGAASAPTVWGAGRTKQAAAMEASGFGEADAVAGGGVLPAESETASGADLRYRHLKRSADEGSQLQLKRRTVASPVISRSSPLRSINTKAARERSLG